MKQRRSMDLGGIFRGKFAGSIDKAEKAVYIIIL